MKKIEVSAIKEGTVIDHISPGNVFAIAKILKLKDLRSTVLIGTNLASSKHKRKGVIKIEDKTLSNDETDKIALLVPDATVNIIKNYQVVGKHKVKIPKKIAGLVKCFNPNCITNKEEITTEFEIISSSPLTMRCKYCERTMGPDEIIFY